MGGGGGSRGGGGGSIPKHKPLLVRSANVFIPIAQGKHGICPKETSLREIKGNFEILPQKTPGKTQGMYLIFRACFSCT